MFLTNGTNVLSHKRPIFLALAKYIYHLNYKVLTFDFPGFSESENPQNCLSLKIFDFTKDVHSAIDSLISRIFIQDRFT
jgi:hypothetical protein